MSDLPPGYRWATASETERHAVTANPDMLVVPRTTDDTGAPYTHDEADLALPLKPLPRDEDGHIITSASFGEMHAVRITYNTDPDGNWLDDDNFDNFTLHGDFDSIDLAMQWIEAYPDGDRDIKDMDIICINRVRPASTGVTA